MAADQQMVNYDDQEEEDGLEEYYGKAEEEMPPLESKSLVENGQDDQSSEYSDSKENRRHHDRKHSKSHHRDHKRSKNHDRHSDQELKPPKKAKKEEQILQDQSAVKNSPKVGEPLIGEDGEILEDGEIADDQEAEIGKDDDDGEVEDDEAEDTGEKEKEEGKNDDGSEHHDKKDKRKRKRDRHRDQSSKRRRSKEDSSKDKQKKKKRHHDYKDYDKVEDDYDQGWMPSKDDRHRDRSPPSPYDSPDEEQEFGSPRGDRERRQRMSGDRSEKRFNSSRGNRSRGRGGRNNRGRDRDRGRDRGKDRDRERGDREKERGGSKRRNSGDSYRSPPGPYDSPSDEEYDGDNRFGGRKPKTMMSLVEGEYLDPSMTTNENERLQHNKNKNKKKRQQEYRERRDKDNEEEQPVKKKPLLQTPMEERPHCRFYREGKCHKGDDCPFNHDFDPERKLELCKFYLISHNCRNRDTCLYMHEDFPCKYFHTGMECYSGDNCRFSHEPLTEEMEQALNNLMEGRLGGDEEEDYEERRRKKPSLLGSPPREQEEWVKERMKGIPSLFDITTYPPGQSPKKPPPNSQAQQSPAMQRPQGFYSETNMSPQTGPNQMRFNGPNQGNSPRPPFMPGPQGPGMPFPGSDMQGPGGMPGPGMQGNPMGPPPPINQAAALVGAILRAAPMLQQQFRGPNTQGPPTSLPMGQQGPPTSGPGGMMMGHGQGMQGPGEMSMMGPNMMGPPNMPQPIQGNMGDQGFMGQQQNMMGQQTNMGMGQMGQNFGMDPNNVNTDPNNQVNVNMNPMDPRFSMTQSANLDNQDMEIENQSESKDMDLRGSVEDEAGQTAGKVDMSDVDLRSDVDMRGDRNESKEAAETEQQHEEIKPELKSDDLGFEIPAHLPKKQREMFIRIQQHQMKERERLEKEKAKEAQEKPSVKEEDDWSYSSDEEEDKKANRPNIFQSITAQSNVKETSDASRSPLSGGSTSLDVMQMINAIKSQSASSKPVDPRQRPDSAEPPKAPVRHPEPTIINSREGECPYRLIRVLYIKQRIPTNISLSDSKFKNDPRVQKMLRQQELESGIVIDHSGTTVQPVDPRVKLEMAKGLSEPKFPLLDTKKESSLPRPELTPFVDPRSKPELTPFVDPRLVKSETPDPRIKTEKPLDPRIKNMADFGNKPTDPRLQRMQSNQGLPTQNLPGIHNLPVRPMDPRLARQDSNSSVSGRPLDPRLGRQNSRDKSNPGNSPSDPRFSSKGSPCESFGDPRLGRQTSDPRFSSVETFSENSFSSKPMDPRLGRVADLESGPPSVQRQFSQPSTMAEKVCAETKTEQKPKLDYRNDPRFKRKPISESNLSQSPTSRPTTSALRKTSTEYSSPLGAENQNEDSSGYNSYNKPRPKNPGQSSVNAPKLKITPDMVPKASEDITTHDILDSLQILSPPVMEEPTQPDKHLKDLFKTIDPTASPFC